MSGSERGLNLHAKAWLAMGIGPQRDTPALASMSKPLSETRLALVTSGGLVPADDEPFDTGKSGDPSFREIPVDVDVASLEIYHPHYDHEPAKRDMNIVFPLPLGRELVDEGVIGGLAKTHYSFMGYVPLTRKLESVYAPQVAGLLERQAVDAVLLTPA